MKEENFSPPLGFEPSYPGNVSQCAMLTPVGFFNNMSKFCFKVINAVDDDPEPNDYVYVARNCQTKLMPIDRNISNLKV